MAAYCPVIWDVRSVDWLKLTDVAEVLKTSLVNVIVDMFPSFQTIISIV